MYEGYAKPALKQANEDTLIAVDLIHKATACKNIYYLDECMEAGYSAGFKKIKNQNLTNNIMPNLVDIYRYVKKLFRFPLRIKLMFLLD